jgi:hypothetical protein
MPTGYYSGAGGEKKPWPVSAHTHRLTREQFNDVGISADDTATDPKSGQGIYWVGNGPTDAEPGKWFAGDAPTKAPVQETVLTNWFEPTTWLNPQPRRGYIADTVAAGDVASRLALVESGTTNPDLVYEKSAASPSIPGDVWYIATTREWLYYLPTSLDPGTTDGGATFPAGWVQTIINPDGAAGTWRPTTPLQAVPGNGFSWEGPLGGNGRAPFGIASETVDGYIRLQTQSEITIEWGLENESGARPISYGAAGIKSAGEYVYRITVLAMALGPHTSSTGPWKISLGMKYYKNNSIRTGLVAPEESSTPIVWGTNQVEIDKIGEIGTDQWVAVECYMNGRALEGDAPPTDAPVGTSKSWTDDDLDAPYDGYYFTPVIKVEGADADVLIDSVQVFRGQRQLTVPGGLTTTSVTAQEAVQTPIVTTSKVHLTNSGATRNTELVFNSPEEDASQWSPEGLFRQGYAAPQPPVTLDVDRVLLNWDDTFVDPPVVLQRINYCPTPYSEYGASPSPGTFGTVEDLADGWWRFSGSISVNLAGLGATINEVSYPSVDPSAANGPYDSWVVALDVANVSVDASSTLELRFAGNATDEGEGIIASLEIAGGTTGRISLTADLTGMTSTFFYVNLLSTGGLGVTDSIEVRNVVLERQSQNADANTFFDPDAVGNEWLGTAGSSLSRQVPTSPGDVAAHVLLDTITLLDAEPYYFYAKVSAPAGAADYRVALYGQGYADTEYYLASSTTTPDGTEQVVELLWTQPIVGVDGQTVRVGLEVDKPGADWSTVGEHRVVDFQVYQIVPDPAVIEGLSDPTQGDHPVTLSYLESLELGRDEAGTTNIVHAPDATDPEPVEDPAEPFEDGAIWANPTAPMSVPTFFRVVLLGISNEILIPGVGLTEIPNTKSMQFTAPGPGVLYITLDADCHVRDNYMYLQMSADTDGGHDYFVTSRVTYDIASGTNAHQMTLSTKAWAAYASAGSTRFRVLAQTPALDNDYPRVDTVVLGCLWFPGAVMQTSENPGGSDADATFAPFARVRSGDSWLPEAATRVAGYEELDPAITIVNVSTSTSISGGGTQNGGSRTLTATVSSGSGTPVGSVQFKKNGSTFSTKTLSGGKASVSVSTTGTYSVSYLGGQSGANNYQPSNSGNTNVTIRQLKTYTYSQNAKWTQTITSARGPRDDNNYVYEGYYSSTWGTYRGYVGFNRLNVSNLYDVTKVEVSFYVQHTYYGGGKDMDIGWHKATGGTPTSNPSRSENQQSAYHNTGSKTVNITSWAKSVVARSDFGGIMLGSGSAANLNHYGYCRGGTGDWSLRITYRRWV